MFGIPSDVNGLLERCVLAQERMAAALERIADQGGSLVPETEER